MGNAIVPGARLVLVSDRFSLAIARLRDALDEELDPAACYRSPLVSQLKPVHYYLLGVRDGHLPADRLDHDQKDDVGKGPSANCVALL